MGGFNNPIIGGGGTLVYPAIKSPDFVDSVSGWEINKDGSAEFNNLEIRGTFIGTNWAISASGVFFYNGTPAANNLIMSFSNMLTGTDPYGNEFLSGLVTYALVGGTYYAFQFAAGATSFPAIVQYSAATEAGPWSQIMEIQTDNLGDWAIIPKNTAAIQLDGPVQATGIVTNGAGTNSSGSAPSPGQTLTINAAAAQLSDTTRDYQLYLTFSGAGNVTVQAGPTSAVARTIYPTAAAVAGAPYPVRMPAGWFIKCTGTGTVAIASQTVVGC